LGEKKKREKRKASRNREKRRRPGGEKKGKTPKGMMFEPLGGRKEKKKERISSSISGKVEIGARKDGLGEEKGTGAGAHVRQIQGKEKKRGSLMVAGGEGRRPLLRMKRGWGVGAKGRTGPHPDEAREEEKKGVRMTHKENPHPSEKKT